MTEWTTTTTITGLKLTDQNDRELVVFLPHVTRIHKVDDCSRIHLVDGSSVLVKNSYEQILSLLQNGQK